MMNDRLSLFPELSLVFFTYLTFHLITLCSNQLTNRQKHDTGKLDLNVFLSFVRLIEL